MQAIILTGLCADKMLASRGEVVVSCEELDELRSLAASGSDSAELAQETADLVALLHQARTSNASVSHPCYECILAYPTLFWLKNQAVSELQKTSAR